MINVIIALSIVVILTFIDIIVYTNYSDEPSSLIESKMFVLQNLKSERIPRFYKIVSVTLLLAMIMWVLFNFIIN